MSEIDTSMKDAEQNDLNNKPAADIRHFFRIKLLPLVLTVVVFVLDQGTKLATGTKPCPQNSWPIQ